jgi:hypothetical protein
MVLLGTGRSLRIDYRDGDQKRIKIDRSTTGITGSTTSRSVIC